MFSAKSTVRRLLTPSRMAILGAPVMLAGLAAPMMGAGPWDWHWGKHEPRRVEVVVATPPPVVIVQPVDVAPCDLRITAYQARDTVMVMVNGSNATGGFTTSLAAIDTRDHCPELVLHNVRGGGFCTQAITPISLNAAFRSHGDVPSVKVRVADHVIVVPVRDVPSL
jgi:hypothetical protein